MAKRKRLTPANPEYLVPDSSASGAGAAAGDGLETKAMYPLGVAPASRAAPPIANVAAVQAATAALDEISETLRVARQQGRMVIELPLDVVQLDYLVRDRVANDDADMVALRSSLHARGQQTPIEVADLGDGRYGLISGWRRCQALRQLQQDGTGSGQVLALLRRPQDAAQAYLAMVEENEIRVGLSYYERARIAAKAVEQGVFETEKKALLNLFAAASRAKRSKIRSFLSIVQSLDGALRFPEALGERAGLTLAKALDARPALGDEIRAALAQAAPESAAAEHLVVLAALHEKQSLNPALGSKSKPIAPLTAPVILTSQDDGSLTLSGPGVDASLHRDLQAWLQKRQK